MPGDNIAVHKNRAMEASTEVGLKYPKPWHYMELSDKLAAPAAINPGVHWQKTKWAKVNP
jgi:hypothetical protein